MGRIIVALSFEVILLVLSIQTGESIKCYLCASNINNKCADPIDKSGLEPIECKASLLDDATSAVKDGVNTISKFFGMTDITHGSDFKFACKKMDISDQSGNKHTLRGCSPVKNEAFDPCAVSESVLKWGDGTGKPEYCGTCETDLCNGAIQHSVTIISAFVVPCFAIIISRWFGA